MKKEIIVDRLEGNMVIVEYNLEMFNLPLEWFKFTPQEGDVLNVTFVQDHEAKKSLKQHNQSLLDRILAKQTHKNDE